MRLIGRIIKRYIWGFLTAISFLTVEALCDLMQPTMMSFIVDNGVANKNIPLVLYYGAGMLGIALIGAFGAVMRNIFATRISMRAGKELRSELFTKIQSFSSENIDRLEPASLITRITNDVTQIQNLINGSMRILVKAPITCIGAIALIIARTPELIPVILIMLLISGVFIALNMKIGYPRFGKVQQALDKLNGVSRQFLSSVRVVKVFGQERKEIERFNEAAEMLAGANVRASRVNALFNPLINLTINMGIILVLFIGGYSVNHEVGRIMASVNYMTQILFAVGMISNILNILVRANASAKRVEKVLEEAPSITLPEHPLTPDTRKGISFVNVCFCYAGSDLPVLDNINIHIEPVERIGIIGSTGSGKTSLVSLLPRFYDVTGGCVRVGGADVRSLDITALRRNIAFVSQRAQIFSGTVKDNIRWGKPSASDDEIAAASKKAAAHTYISAFPDGYATLLGQGGVNLSGGQKQRLSLARALLLDPDILILDDCTGALDTTTEQHVINEIFALRGKTVLLISQRISAVQRTDRIVCLDGGRIVGMGTHDELLRSSSVYQEIYDSQIGGEQVGKT